MQDKASYSTKSELVENAGLKTNLFLERALSSDVIVERAKLFSMEIKSQFISKVDKMRNKALGLEKITSRTEELYASISGGSAGADVSLGIAKLLTKIPECIPIIGDIIKGGIELVSIGYDVYDKAEQRKHYNETLDKFKEIISKKLQFIGEELGDEMARIYEYQVACLDKEGEIEKAARYAVTKMIDNYRKISDQPGCDPVSKLILGLFEQKNWYLRNIRLQKQYSWNSDSMFKKPMVRVESKKNDISNISYKFFSSQDSRKDGKYGCRGAIIGYDEKKIEEYAENQDYISDYIPLHRLVKEDDLDRYLKSSDLLQFNKYISRYYKLREDRLISVYQVGESLKLKDLSNRCFQSTIFNRADFSEVISLCCSNWSDSCLRGANLSGLPSEKSEGITLTKANMRYANLSGSSLLSNASDVVDADISYSNIIGATIEKGNIPMLKAKEEVMLSDAKLVDKKGIKLDELEEKVPQLEVKINRLELEVKEEHAIKIKESIINYTDPIEFSSQRHEFIILQEKIKDYSTVSITGIAGSGKTQLAREYAKYFSQRKFDEPIVIWELLADTKDNLERSYINLGRKLQIEKNKLENCTLTEIKNEVKTALEAKKCQYLLIYDNLIPELHREGLLNISDDNNAHIIITTQHTLYYKSSPSLPELSLNDGMILDEAIAFIRQKREDITKKEAEDLALELDCLPLALDAAKMYINDIFSISKYLALLAKEKKGIEGWQAKKLAKERHYSYTQEAAIRLVLRKAMEENSQVKDFLKPCIFLAANSIPLEIIKEFFPAEGANTLVRECLEILSKFSIIKDKKGLDGLITFSIHRITQKIISEYVEQEQQPELLMMTLEIMCKKFKKNLTFGQKEFNFLLLPHVEKLIEQAKKDGKLYYYAACLLDVKAYFYMQTGRVKEGAVELAKEAKTIVESLVGLDNLQEGVLSMEALFKVSNDFSVPPNSPSLALLYSSILYNSCRTYFYTKDSSFKDESKNLLNYAKELIEKLSTLDGKKYLLEILIQRSGALYHLLEGSAEDVKEALNRYKALLAVEGQYIDEREGEVDLTKDKFHKQHCCRQLIKAAKKLSKEHKGEEKKEYYRLAMDYAGKLIELVESDLEERGRIASYYNEIGFLLIDKENPLRDLGKALSYFTRACVIEESGNEGKGWFDYPLVDAHKGLALVSLEKGDISAASGHSKRSLEICQHIHADKSAKKVLDAMDLVKTVAACVIKISWRDYVSKSKDNGAGKGAGI